MTVKKDMNGYYLACRLLYLLLSTYPGGFGALCLDFGPIGWDEMDEESKMVFKHLAARYKTSAAWAWEQAHPGHLDRETFISNVFENTEEIHIVCDILEPIFYIMS